MQLTNTTDIYGMMQGYVDSAALNTALELGLFWMLAQQTNIAERVAQALGILPNSTTRFRMESARTRAAK